MGPIKLPIETFDSLSAPIGILIHLIDYLARNISSSQVIDRNTSLSVDGEFDASNIF